MTRRGGIISTLAAVGFSLLLLLVSHARGQPTAPPSPEDRVRVCLITIGPGELAYERFGHNMIWLHDPVAGTDAAYNYGVFDFEQENFIWRFVQGRMLYWCDAMDADAIRRRYAAAGYERDLSPDQWLTIEYLANERDVWVQELNLTGDQKAELRRFLEWNVQPENRGYRYDYYRDNCSTRVRDALDRQGVLGGAIRGALEGHATDRTYRWHTRRLAKVDPLLYTALYAALGQPVDVTLTHWEEGFLPVKLMEYLREVRVQDEAGREVPLVKREYSLTAESAFPEPNAPPRRAWAVYLAIGVVLGAAMIVLARVRHWTGRWATAGLVGVWSLIAGISGVVWTWAWFTDHTFAHWNENWLQLNPLSMVVLIAGVGAAVARERRRRRVAWIAAICVAGFSILGLVLQVLPAMDQVNGELICLALPLHLGVLGAVMAKHRSGPSMNRAA